MNIPQSLGKGHFRFLALLLSVHFLNLLFDNANGLVEPAGHIFYKTFTSRSQSHPHRVATCTRAMGSEVSLTARRPQFGSAMFRDNYNAVGQETYENKRENACSLRGGVDGSSGGHVAGSWRRFTL
jgi:hypothetical protein